MELDEAIREIAKISQGEYFTLYSVETEEITLDGTFTVKQLEAIITIFRSRDKIHLLE